MRNLTNDETEYTFGRNLSNDNGEILSFDLSANLPLVYTSNTDEASVIGLKGLNALGTANQILAMDSSGTNMIFKDDNDTNFWNLNSNSLTPKLDSYNVIIGDEDNANSNNVELLVYGDMELKNTLFSTNNNQNKIDFDTTYGIDFYGFYYSPSSRSYNMSFRNNQHGSNFPYLGVSNTGDFLFHINGRGDSMIMKADATRDVLITAGDLIGETSGLYSKNRMKDIYCRNIFAEPIVIKNATSGSSAYISMFEASDNGTNYIKLQAPVSLASDAIDIVLPSTAGTIALQSEIRTDAQIRGLFSGTSPISVSASGVISTTFTPTSTDNVSGKTFTDLTNFNASLSVKNSSNFGTGSVRFYDLDNSHYTEVRSPNTMLQNAGITLPNVTCVLSYEGQNISVFTNNAGYITATSTETLENKTLKSPIFTSTSGAYEKMILKDENLTHNINIFTPNLTDNINVAFPSETGTLAITDNIPDLTTATNFGTSAPSTITIGSSSRQMELEATNFTFTDTNGTSILKITDSDVEINGADFGIKARTSSDPPRLYFWDSDRSHYIALQGQEIGSNVNLTLPHVTAELAYKGQNISDFTNNSNYVDATGVLTQIASAENISTASVLGNPTRNFGNAASANIINGTSTTITNLICTGSSGDFSRISLKDNTLSYNAEIKCLPFTDNRTFHFVNESGTILTTGDIATAHIRGQITATTPISYDVNTGIISTTFTPTSTTNISGKTFTDPLIVSPTNTSSFYAAKFLAASIADGGYVEMVLGKANATKNCATWAYYHSSDGANANFSQFGMKGQETAITIKGDGTTTITNGATTNKITAINTSSNIIESNATYGWEVTGNNSEYSFALKNGTATYMYMGSPSATTPFQQHINGVGDSYLVTNDRHHNFIGEYFSTNSTSINGSAEVMGFTTYLAAAYASTRFPVLATNGQYLYVSVYNNIGGRTGGTYCGYIGSSGFVDISDKRYKKDITTITNPFDIINNIRGVNFKWNEASGKEDGVEHIGFLAQELNEVIPQVCNYDEKTDSWGIYKADINAVLVEGMKELKKQVEEQKKQIDQQQQIIDKLLSSNSFKEFKS